MKIIYLNLHLPNSQPENVPAQLLSMLNPEHTSAIFSKTLGIIECVSFRHFPLPNFSHTSEGGTTALLEDIVNQQMVTRNNHQSISVDSIGISIPVPQNNHSAIQNISSITPTVIPSTLSDFIVS